MSYIDATYLQTADDFVNEFNNNNVSMDEAVDFLTVHGDEEPDWFNPEDYFLENIPIAGFVEEKAIMIDEGEWVSVEEGDKELNNWVR